MSGKEVGFLSKGTVGVGDKMVLHIEWPVLLGGEVSLQLMATAEIVQRSGPLSIARLVKHTSFEPGEFNPLPRERGSASQIVAWSAPGEGPRLWLQWRAVSEKTRCICLCFDAALFYNRWEQAGGVSVEFHLFDAEYVRKLSECDPATESHFSAYFGRFILTKLRARRVSRELAEDIQQETLLRVLKSLRQGSGVSQPERFGAFVNAVSNNVLLEFQHKDSRHPPVEGDAPEMPDSAANIDVTLVR